MEVPWTWFVVAVVAEALPPLLLKRWTDTRVVGLVVAAAVLYAVLIYAYMQTLPGRPVSTLYTLMKLAAIGLVVGMGVVFLGERPTAQQWAGVALGCVAVVLLTHQF